MPSAICPRDSSRQRRAGAARKPVARLGRWACAGALIAIVAGTGPAAARRTPARPEPAPSAALEQIRVYQGKPAPFALQARSALLVAGRTGAVLYAFNEHERMQPASLAKIMTFYLALEALKAGKIAQDTRIPISKDAWRLSMDQSVSRMFLEVGSQVSVHDLLLGLMVSSGNDAAGALAEYLGGSSEGFIEMMNREAARLGLSETRFASPDGLPEPNQYTTAADMVKLARIVVERHPEALAITATKEFTFHGIAQPNFNSLLFHDSRVDGLKTGHVAEAGYHLVATARSGSLQLVSAVMGARSPEKRRLETEKLLDWAFRSFVAVAPDWRAAAPVRLRVYQGSGPSVAIAPAGPVELTVARGEEKQVKLAARLDSGYLLAPVERGATVGDLTLFEGDKPLATIELQTTSAVTRGSLLHVLADRVRLMFRWR